MFLNMSQTEISRLENLINKEKESLELLLREKSSLINNQETKKKQLVESSRRASTMPHSGPMMMALIRQASELESVFLREKLDLEAQITTLKRKIELKERELFEVKHCQQQRMWSSSFK
jgi:hypothetical protein